MRTKLNELTENNLEEWEYNIYNKERNLNIIGKAILV